MNRIKTHVVMSNWKTLKEDKRELEFELFIICIFAAELIVMAISAL